MGWCDYPSNLNVSALRFQRCSQCHGGGDGKCGGEGSDSCSMLGDDLILCRLSSLLSPALKEVSPKTPDANNNSNNNSSSNNTSISSEENACTTDKVVENITFTIIPADTSVVLPTILPRENESLLPESNVRTNNNNPVGSLLSLVGIEEVEALDPGNGGPSAGQCQFACIASALLDGYGAQLPLKDGFRPDLELRNLALHVIRMNMDMYRDYLTTAGGRTRSQSQEGGTSVDINTYIRKMSSPSCDGDAVTLQALCDALKITVRVIKPVCAGAYNEKSQRQRLHAASVSTRASVVSEDSDEDERRVNEDDISVSSSSSSTASSFHSFPSSLSWSSNPYSSVEGIRQVRSSAHRGGRSAEKRLYIGQEIWPRHLPLVDSRIRSIQGVVGGRLVWLSHVGNEAHYRFLRPSMDLVIQLSDSSSSSSSSSSGDLRGPMNREEAEIAHHTKNQRQERIRNLCHLEDGFVHSTELASNEISIDKKEDLDETRRARTPSAKNGSRKRKACERNAATTTTSPRSKKKRNKIPPPRRNGKKSTTKKNSRNVRKPKKAPFLRREAGKRKVRPVMYFTVYKQIFLSQN